MLQHPLRRTRKARFVAGSERHVWSIGVLSGELQQILTFRPPALRRRGTRVRFCGILTTVLRTAIALDHRPSPVACRASVAAR
jgi:hypothetical protein